MSSTALNLERRLQARLESEIRLGSPKLLERVVEFARDRGVRRALDLGAGCGELVARLRAEGVPAAGLDLCGALLERARKQAGPDAGLLRGDAERLPVASGQLDLVTCLLVAHYLERPQRALSEAARILRPDGWLVLADRIAAPAPALRERQQRIESLRNPSVRKLLTTQELMDELRRAGFRVRMIEFLEEPLTLDDWLAGVDQERVAWICRELWESPVRDLGGLRFEAPRGVRVRIDLILAQKLDGPRNPGA
jgi:SAM-dependent methyltransferase